MYIWGHLIGGARSAIADLKMLADSASRSGNVYQALQAYHKMGVVYDNQHKYEEAIQKYKQFLALCITSRNTQGEASYMASGGDSCKALAYNCLGIDCFKMGRGPAIDRSWKRPKRRRSPIAFLMNSWPFSAPASGSGPLV